MDHTCPRCKYTLPVRLTYAGKHIKASCAQCLSYIKFVPQATIPPYQESKNKIWCLTQDLDLIKESKDKLSIHDDLKGVHKNMAYHNLYLDIILTHFS